MPRYKIFIKAGGNERSTYAEAPTEAEAIAKVKASLSGTEKQWGSVFADADYVEDPADKMNREVVAKVADKLAGIATRFDSFCGRQS